MTGEKKDAAEAMAKKDPVSGDSIYDHDKIKNASLMYFQNSLKDKKPDEEYWFDVKVRELLLGARVNEIVKDGEHEEFTEDAFTK